jgi:peptide/nickel transport system substrate-binding protein
MFFTNRKRLLAIASIVVTALIIGACGPTATPAPTTAPVVPPITAPVAAPTTAPVAAPTAAPAAAATATTAAPVAKKAGDCGKLNILYWQAVTILNSHLSQGTKDFDASRLVTEPLASMGADGNPVANLAAEIPTKANGGFAADGSSTTWKLKQGLKWSDGTAFTADDVVFTWKWVTTKETAAVTAGNWIVIKSVEAVDPNTVKVTYTDPQPSPYTTMVANNFHILQKKQFQPFIGAASTNGPNLATIGTGPYMIVDAKPGDVVTFTMNPNYRDIALGKPCFKDVTFKGGGDAASAAKAVCQTADIDYGWNLQVEAAVLNPMLQAADSKCVLAIAPSGNVERLSLNFANPDSALGDKRADPDQPHPFLSDLKVRQALAMAIDNSTMAVQLYGPAGVGTCNIVTAPPAVVSKNTTCKADIAAANKLLDDAGWAKGSDGIRHKTVNGKDVQMSILYQTTVNPLRQKEQAFVKNAWDQLGVKTELKSINAGVFFSSDEANPDTAAHFYADVEMFTSGPDGPDTINNWLQGWSCAETAKETKAGKFSGLEYGRYCSKAYDDLLAQLNKEADPAKRAALIIQLNDTLIKDVVIIPLVNRTQPTDGISKAIKGDIANPWDSVLWNIADWTK